MSKRRFIFAKQRFVRTDRRFDFAKQYCYQSKVQKDSKNRKIIENNR